MQGGCGLLTLRLQAVQYGLGARGGSSCQGGNAAFSHVHHPLQQGNTFLSAAVGVRQHFIGRTHQRQVAHTRHNALREAMEKRNITHTEIERT